MRLGRLGGQSMAIPVLVVYFFFLKNCNSCIMAYWQLLLYLELIWFSKQQCKSLSTVCGEWFYQENVLERFYQACNSRSSLFYISVPLATDSSFLKKSCCYFPVYKMAHHWWHSVGPLDFIHKPLQSDGISMVETHSIVHTHTYIRVHAAVLSV